MAEFYIVSVRHEPGYGRGSGNIASMLVVEVLSVDTFSIPKRMTVGEVIAGMTHGHRYATGLARDGGLYYGAPVSYETRGAVTFLRTVANGVLVDNLDDLPEA